MCHPPRRGEGMKSFNLHRVREEQRKQYRSLEEEEAYRKRLEAKKMRKERAQKRIDERDAMTRARFKPCPFCGCDLPGIPYPGDITAFVQCTKCGATGPSVNGYEGNPDNDNEAAKLWNKRANDGETRQNNGIPLVGEDWVKPLVKRQEGGKG